MLSYVLKNIIEIEFDKHCGTEKEKRVGNEYGRRKFGLRIDLDFTKKRVVNLLLYGEFNYVGVYWKFDKDEEWIVEGYYDSCWRESLSHWINQHDREISCIHDWVWKNLKHETWYKVHEVTDAEVKALTLIRKKRYELC